MSTRLRHAMLTTLAALAACAPRLEGNGVYAERVIDVSGHPFDRAAIGFAAPVEVGSDAPSAAIVVVASNPARRVVLTGDENVIDHITVEVDGHGTLRTSTGHSYTAFHPPRLFIQVPTLVAVESIGGSEVTVQDAASTTFAVTADDEGRVTLAGQGGDALEVVLGGGARLDAEGYPVASAQVDLSGGARATIWCSGVVAGNAAGGSLVQVKGSGSCEVAPAASCAPLH